MMAFGNVSDPDRRNPTGGGSARRIVLVSGPSGAGRSTALHRLEDLGYEVIDNLPLSLAPRLLEEPRDTRPLALGVDVRNREFDAGSLVAMADEMKARADLSVELLYLDCTAETLLRRFSETRRRHPLAPEETPSVGIAAEMALLGPVRARADVLINTSDMTPHDLAAEITEWFALGGGRQLAVSVQSFSYKMGLPRGADMVFDCRFLDNPHWKPDLRALDGRDSAVAAHVSQDPRFEPFFTRIRDLVLMVLPAHLQEGKSHLSIAFGCTGGRHRSVVMAERLAQTLAEDGWRVSKLHRELDRGDAGGAPDILTE
jgi:UPF0042 nucleotide-binding protein